MVMKNKIEFLNDCLDCSLTATLCLPKAKWTHKIAGRIQNQLTGVSGVFRRESVVHLMVGRDHISNFLCACCWKSHITSYGMV
ncbi:hypothetical protein RIF29_36983 [Crotalaria pallida]|uniref:Uncharacterized protein n=1 Tax=Crotalaria pallida TaxID=3830 RepID=A0AAN9EIB2_CROPI